MKAVLSIWIVKKPIIVNNLLNCVYSRCCCYQYFNLTFKVPRLLPCVQQKIFAME